jgi:hypothetical protein
MLILKKFKIDPSFVESFLILPSHVNAFATGMEHAHAV